MSDYFKEHIDTNYIPIKTKIKAKKQENIRNKQP